MASQLCISGDRATALPLQLTSTTFLPACEGPQYLALHGGELYRRTVAVVKSRLAHLGLLALECGRYTPGKHYYVGISGTSHHIIDSQLLLAAYVKIESSSIGYLHIVYTDIITLALLHRKFAATVVKRLSLPALMHSVAIDDDTQSVVIVVDYIKFLVGLGYKRPAQAQSEMLELDSGSKHSVAAIVKIYR